MRGLSLLALLGFANCQCLTPVDEGVPDDAQGFCDQLTSLFLCGRAQACESKANGTSCEQLVNPSASRYAQLCTPRLWQDLDAGVVVFDPSAARACVEQWRTTCGGRNCLRDVFRGTLGVGTDCHANLECRPGTHCALSDQCPGTCAAMLADGAETNDTAACGSGFAAGLADGGVRCASRGERGASCLPASDEVSAVPCADGLACVSGRCGTTLREGAACTAGQCDLGLVCSMSGTCRRWAQQGEDCSDAWCAQGLRCDATQRVCVAPAGLGGACSFHSDCRAPLACRAGACATLGAEGAACSTFWDCEATLVCLRGACAKPVPLDGSCPEPTVCAQGLVCNDGRCVLGACG